MQQILEVGIGLVLAVAALSVVVSSTMELLSAAARMRAHALEQGIARMLDDQKRTAGAAGLLARLGVRGPEGASPYTAAVLRHPLIQALSSARAPDRPPSYIDSVTFVTALLGSSFDAPSLIARVAADKPTIDEYVTNLPPGGSPESEDAKVRTAWDESNGDRVRFFALLLDDETNGVTSLATFLRNSADVKARIDALTSAGDPAAAPLVAAWSQAGGEATTFDAERFVRAVKTPQLIAAAAAGSAEVSRAIETIKESNAHLGTSLESLWLKAGAEFSKFRRELEDWFDREMARVSGWYSRWTQWIMVAVGILLAVVLNISLVTIGKTLWTDPTLRSAVVAEAERAAEPSTPAPSGSAETSTAVAPVTPSTATTPTSEVATATTNSGDVAPSTGDASGTSEQPDSPTVTQAVSDLDELGLPIGWSSTAWPGWDPFLLLHLIGMLMVGVAASFGAPFWFDLLNRVVNLRAAGKPPPTAAEQRT
jgi:hypothetical protein